MKELKASLALNPHMSPAVWCYSKRQIFIYIYIFFFNRMEINSAFIGKHMWREGVMNFQLKLGKCFQVKEEMLNHIFLQRRLNAGFQHNF